MSKARSTAVLPSKYYARELENVDPRFYVEKDMIAIVPYDTEQALVPEQAVVLNSSIIRKTLVVTQELVSANEIKKSKNNFKKKHT